MRFVIVRIEISRYLAVDHSTTAAQIKIKILLLAKAKSKQRAIITKANNNNFNFSEQSRAAANKQKQQKAAKLWQQLSVVSNRQTISMSINSPIQRLSDLI